jgi:pimeloyl-ACP methyl ester carboxylesterase
VVSESLPAIDVTLAEGGVGESESAQGTGPGSDEIQTGAGGRASGTALDDVGRHTLRAESDRERESRDPATDDQHALDSRHSCLSSSARSNSCSGQPTPVAFRDPYTNRAAYKDHSPITFIRHRQTPPLLLHGDNDSGVPIAQGYEFYTGLSVIGVETELVIYPREGHSIQERGHQDNLQRRVLAWFDRHLKEPDGPATKARTPESPKVPLYSSPPSCSPDPSQPPRSRSTPLRRDIDYPSPGWSIRH